MIGATRKATNINKETKKIFKVKIFLLINSSILFFIFIIFNTSNACAIISNIIKAKSTNILKNLYKSFSISIPKKMECNIRNTADPIPKKRKYLLLVNHLIVRKGLSVLQKVAIMQKVIIIMILAKWCSIMMVSHY